MTDKTDNAAPIIVDFGLACIKGPGQLAIESSGTLGYCGPEVLSGSYNNKCDLWSYGCLVFALLSNYLPFDSKEKNELIRMVKEDELQFK